MKLLVLQLLLLFCLNIIGCLSELVKRDVHRIILREEIKKPKINRPPRHHHQHQPRRHKHKKYESDYSLENFSSYSSEEDTYKKTKRDKNRLPSKHSEDYFSSNTSDDYFPDYLDIEKRANKHRTSSQFDWGYSPTNTFSKYNFQIPNGKKYRKREKHPEFLDNSYHSHKSQDFSDFSFNQDSREIKHFQNSGHFNKVFPSSGHYEVYEEQ